jgi:hypothetical protein
MPDPDPLIDVDDLPAATIDDYLVSLAEGVAEAQRRLDAVRVSGAGGSVRYRIPKLDFQLRMTVNIERQPVPVGSKRRAPVLKMQALRETSQASIASTISGSLIAIPEAGSAPDPVIGISVTQPEELPEGAPEGVRALAIQISLIDRAGTALVEETVQLTIDRERMGDLDQDASLAAGTGLAESVLQTDEYGLATTWLWIGGTQSPDTRLVLVADAMARTKELIVPVENLT